MKTRIKEKEEKTRRFVVKWKLSSIALKCDDIKVLCEYYRHVWGHFYKIIRLDMKVRHENKNVLRCLMRTDPTNTRKKPKKKKRVKEKNWKKNHVRKVNGRRILMDDGFRKFRNDHFTCEFTCRPPSDTDTHHTWYIIRFMKVAIFATKNHFRAFAVCSCILFSAPKPQRYLLLSNVILKMLFRRSMSMSMSFSICSHMRVYRIAGSSSHSANDTNSLNYLRK